MGVFAKKFQKLIKLLAKLVSIEVKKILSFIMFSL